MEQIHHIFITKGLQPQISDYIRFLTSVKSSPYSEQRIGVDENL